MTADPVLERLDRMITLLEARPQVSTVSTGHSGQSELPEMGTDPVCLNGAWFWREKNPMLYRALDYPGAEAMSARQLATATGVGRQWCNTALKILKEKNNDHA